ncbi:MAG: TetR/AcrR family transcriptional regulator [Gammaproteobacteria bacterium]|nr:TetR/AcrR family transcriptional regulator [Gammaproteobacteria bacterium]
MSRKGVETREKILDAAQAMVLSRGFSGVSVDKVIESLGVTKGAFFHHFKNKQDLATALIVRYAQADMDYFNEALARGERLSNDPLQQLLIFIGLYEELFAGLAEPYPGCLLATYIHEAQLFDEDVENTINNVFLTWRQELLKRLKVIAANYPARRNVDLPSLADEFIILIEGAFLLSKSLRDVKIVPQQLRHYRTYLEMIFLPDV